MKWKDLEYKAKRDLKKFMIIFILLGMIGNLTYRKTSGISPERTVMRTDSEGYYQYLPHVFIFDWDRMDKMHWAIKYGDENKNLNLYTCGVAIMQTPFFLIAHGLSYFGDYETTGYTSIYFLSVFFASLFYVLLGLVLIYMFLRHFFNHNTSLWTIILLFFATNLFYYTILAPGMAHAYSFGIIAIFIYFIPSFYDNPTLKNLLLIAFPLALATLIRPTSLLIAIFFFLYGVNSWSALKQRLSFWIKKWHFLLVMLACGFIMFIPQMLYWHTITGKYIFYSYVGGGFSNWMSPHIFTVLLGPRNGWFVYTPLMLLATGGLLYLLAKGRFSSPAIIIVMILIIYVNGSWWCPTFSGAAGYRALIGFLPFMAVPLGFVIEQTNSKNIKYLKIAMISLFVIFIIYNILFSYKYSHWLWWNTEWQWSHMLRLFKF